MGRKAKDWNNAAAWLGAIGEPTRLTILITLTTADKSTSELARFLRDEMETIMFHVGILRKVGLVTWDKDGRPWRCRLRGATVIGNELILTHESGIRVFLPLA